MINGINKTTNESLDEIGFINTLPEESRQRVYFGNDNILLRINFVLIFINLLNFFSHRNIWIRPFRTDDEWQKFIRLRHIYTVSIYTHVILYINRIPVIIDVNRERGLDWAILSPIYEIVYLIWYVKQGRIFGGREWVKLHPKQCH